MNTILLHNILLPGASAEVSRVFFNDDTILAVETGKNGGKLSADGNFNADTVIDGKGMLLMPGCIDAHVHFREPGLTHKADIAGESRAAVAGGVTTWFDMPNTVPPTTTVNAWMQKMELAKESSACHYAFFIGATNDNLSELRKANFSEIPGIKVFLGSSTGNMLVDDEKMLNALFAEFRVPIVVHAEDENIIVRNREEISGKFAGNPPVFAHSDIRSVEACRKATERAVELLRKNTGAHLHIAHLSTADEVAIIRQAKAEGLNITCEVSPHHLLFTDKDYERLGARIKMNPAVKSEFHREALREAVVDGTIDIIATDHAPHTLSEKQGNALTAVSGAPMVQFSLPVVLDLFDAVTVARTMAENPARIFGLRNRGRILPGYTADLVLVQRNSPHTLTDNDVISKCGWTPLVGKELKHRIFRTFVSRPGKLEFYH